MYAIEKGISPPPHQARGAITKLPLAAMEVGDSFFVPKDDMPLPTLRNTAYTRARQLGIGISVRKESEGARVYRMT